MIDLKTQSPLTVLNYGTAGPFIRVLVSQLDEVCRFLDEHQVSYEVDKYSISLNGSPEATLINFGRKADPQAIQKLLDTVQ